MAGAAVSPKGFAQARLSRLPTVPPETRRAAREAAATATADRAVSSVPAHSDEGRPRRPIGRIIWITLALILIVFLVAVAWVGFKALSVRDDLTAAQAQVAALQDGNDPAEAARLMGVHGRAAAEGANDPVWRVLEFVPVAGDNLRAVRLASESLDVLANEVAIPVLDAPEGEGGVLARVLPTLTAASPTVSELAPQVEASAGSPFLIGQVQSGIDQVAAVMEPAALALEILPPMLGAEGERNYLLVFQNNAEALPLGGSAASQSLVHVDNGSVEIVEQASSASFDNGNRVDVEVDQSALDLYTDYLVTHVNTTVSRPDFPTAARSLEAFWNRDINPAPVDGVVSINPLALARVLTATGPIQVGDVEINEENAVRILLSDVYAWWPAGTEMMEQTDIFFADVASQVFSAVSEGNFDLKDMAWAVSASIDSGDIMFYSNDAEVQELIEPERISGILPTANEEETAIGVFFFDTSASKIDFYMDSSVGVAARCESGRSTFDVETGLHLNISQGEADYLPRYVMSGPWGSEHFRTVVYVYGPPGTTLESATVDGRDVQPLSTDISDLGRPVAMFETFLRPDERASVHATFAGEGAFAPVELRSTPMVRATSVDVDGAPCG